MLYLRYKGIGTQTIITKVFPQCWPKFTEYQHKYPQVVFLPFKQLPNQNNTDSFMDTHIAPEYISSHPHLASLTGDLAFVSISPNGLWVCHNSKLIMVIGPFTSIINWAVSTEHRAWLYNVETEFDKQASISPMQKPCLHYEMKRSLWTW